MKTYRGVNIHRNEGPGYKLRYWALTEDGRPDIYHPGNNAEAAKPTPLFYIRRVRINSGGYDQGGAYWGEGQPLYEYESEDYGEDLVSGFMRAADRDDAKDKLRAKFGDEIKFAR